MSAELLQALEEETKHALYRLIKTYIPQEKFLMISRKV